MRRFAGACRFVFNRALALQNENHEAGNKYVSYTKMASWLIEWKSHPDTQWLKRHAITAVAAVAQKIWSAATRISSRSVQHSLVSRNAAKTMPARREARSDQQSYIAS